MENFHFKLNAEDPNFKRKRKKKLGDTEQMNTEHNEYSWPDHLVFILLSSAKRNITQNKTKPKAKKIRDVWFLVYKTTKLQQDFEFQSL